jgi:hypothetical protein
VIIPADQMPIEEYHQSAPAYLSKTSLRAFVDRGPAWWKRRYLDGDTSIDSAPGGAAEGLALDCWLTEGQAAFDARYVVRPKTIDLRTKDGKKWAEDQAEKLMIKEEDYAILTDGVRAVRALPCWPEIEQALAQTTIRRHSDALGLGLQARPDWLAPQRGILWDLKKTRDLDQFGRDAINMGYHLQAAVASWCLAGDGIGLEHAYLVAVEWDHEARARVYEIPHEVLESADRDMREIAAQIAYRIRSNDWTDVQSAPEMLAVPEYMLRKMEVAS